MLTPEEIFKRGEILVNAESICERYHLWYYDTHVWSRMTYMGVPIQKSPSDLWNYQEIIYDLRPTLVIEFGTFDGGSALFFADLLIALPMIAGERWKPRNVVTVDIDQSHVHKHARAMANIEFIQDSSISEKVTDRILKLREDYSGPCFAILDSDHRCEHVFQEMLVMKKILRPGDWLIVEDGNINGHPVSPNVAPGPWEAIKQYEKLYPEDYIQDRVREKKFGFTFAPEGFLVRR